MSARLCIVLCLGFLACGSKAREPQVHQVEIRAMQFVPSELAVAVGDTIVWTNMDIVPHTVTSSTPSVAVFDSQSIANKQRWQYQVTTAGDHAYVCTFHPTMRAMLTAR
jgi:plastocyanin